MPSRSAEGPAQRPGHGVNGSRYRRPQTRSAPSLSPSTRCSIGWPTLKNGSARLWRMRLMSCGAHWPASRPQLEVAGRLGDGGTLPGDLMPDVKRLAGLVEDLLLLARADADTKPAGTVDPSRCPRSCCRGDRAYAAARVPVTLVANKPVMIMVDADELHRAVGNLVDNARAACADAGGGGRQS